MNENVRYGLGLLVVAVLMALLGNEFVRAVAWICAFVAAGSIGFGLLKWKRAPVSGDRS